MLHEFYQSLVEKQKQMETEIETSRSRLVFVYSFVASFFRFSSYSRGVNRANGDVRAVYLDRKTFGERRCSTRRDLQRALSAWDRDGGGWVGAARAVFQFRNFEHAVGATTGIKAIPLQSARLVMRDITLGVSAGNRVYQKSCLLFMTWRAW